MAADQSNTYVPFSANTKVGCCTPSMKYLLFPLTFTTVTVNVLVVTKHSCYYAILKIPLEASAVGNCIVNVPEVAVLSPPKSNTATAGSPDAVSL